MRAQFDAFMLAQFPFSNFDCDMDVAHILACSGNGYLVLYIESLWMLKLIAFSIIHIIFIGLLANPNLIFYLIFLLKFKKF